MLKRLFCAALGHQYLVERVLSFGARKVGCARCCKQWAMHDGTQSFVPWDGEFEELYASGGILSEMGREMLYQLPDGDWIRLESVTHIAVEIELPRLSKVTVRLQEGEAAFQNFKSYEEAVKCRDDLARAVNGV